MSADARTQGRQRLRFLVSGGTAAAVFFCLSFGLMSTGLQPFAASILGYSAAFVAGYALQRSWTFSAEHGHRNALPRYAALQLACALGSGGLAQIMTAMDASAVTVSLVTTLTASLVSYYASSRWVFPQPPRPT